MSKAAEPCTSRIKNESGSQNSAITCLHTPQGQAACVSFPIFLPPFFTAVAAGERQFLAIAIAGSPAETDENGGRKIGKLTQAAWPCGVCRQVMAEFCDTDSFFIVVAESESDYEIRTLRKLLPEGFGSGNLADCIQ